METAEWQDLSPSDRNAVVDQWTIEHKQASPAASDDDIREFNQVVDQFRQAAGASLPEKVGGFLGGVARSIPSSLAAAGASLPTYSTEAGLNIGNAIVGASGAQMVRDAPLTVRTAMAVPGTWDNIKHFAARQMGGDKTKQWATLNQKLDALRLRLLDGQDDPRAVKSLAQQVAVAAAGYHEDDPIGYLYSGAPDGLADPNSFAELVKAERRPTVVNSYGARSADLRGMRTIHADPENLALAAAFRETRNPAYFEELQRRLTMSDSELQRAAVLYANAAPDAEEYERAWGELAPVKYVRRALYGQSDSPIDTALSLSGVGGLFRGVKASVAGGLTLSKIGRGALKSTLVEGTSGAASAIGGDALATGGEIAEQAAAEVLGEAGSAAGSFGVSKGIQGAKQIVGRLTSPATDAGGPGGWIPAPDPAPDQGTAAAGLDLPTGPGEIDPSLLPDAPLTPPTPADPAGTVPETPATLAEQKRRVLDGSLPGMIVPGVSADALPAELVPGEGESLVVTETPDGAVLHSPDIPSEGILASQADGTLMQTLGYATGQKPSTPDAAAVTVRAPDGIEVSAELVAPEDVPAAVAAAEIKAEPGDTVSVEEPAAVVEQRLQSASLAPAALTSGLPTVANAMAQAAGSPATVADPQAAITTAKERLKPVVAAGMQPHAPARKRTVQAQIMDIHPEQAKAISKVAGKGSGRPLYHVVDEDFVRKVLKDHGDPQAETERGNLPVTPDDFDLIPEVLAAPDSITKDQGKDGPAMVFAKRFNGHMVYVATGPNKQGRLRSKTMWKRPAQTRTSPAEAVPPHTSEPLPSEAASVPTDTPAPQPTQAEPTGPGAAAAEEFKPNRFGQRVKADERLRESWRKAMEPRKYRPFTEVELQAYANQWIASQGENAAAALFLDDASGIDTPERTVLGMQLALRLDQAAGQTNDPNTTQSIEVLMDEVVDKLETMATAAGQGLRVFGMWSRMSPQGILRAALRQIEKARQKTKGKMPPISKEQTERLGDLVNQIAKAPEGIAKQDLTRQLLAEVGRIQGVSVMDVLVAIWYANVLSGVDTHVINTFGSGTHLLARMATTALVSHPKDSLAMVKGILEGIEVGWADSKAAMRGKTLTSEQATKFSADDNRNVLELLYTENPQTWRQKAGNLISLGRYVGRLLKAEDGFWNGTARSAAEYLAASRLARQGVREGHGDYATLMAQELGNSPAEAAAALAQAESEAAVSGEKPRLSDLQRRAWQIMEAKRPMSVREEGRRFAEVVTFNSKPEGSWGAVADAMNLAGQGLVIPTPLGNIPIFRMFVAPFVNVVANVVSHGLDFSPIGIVRAAKGSHLIGKAHNLTPFSQAERRQRFAAGAAGTLVIGALLVATLSGDDEENPWFDMTGAGPEDTNKRKQMMDRGWKPWAFKFGDTYLSFQDFPGAPAWAGTAALIENIRLFKQGKIDDLFTTAVMSGLAVGGSMLDKSFLSASKDLITTIEQRNEQAATRWAVRPAQGFVPAVGMLRSIAKVTDPELPNKDGVMAHLVSGIPVIQSIGTRPALNAFGQPITKDWLDRLPAVARFTSRATKDPEFAWLAEHRLFVTDVNGSATVSIPNANRVQTAHVDRIRQQRANRLGRAFEDKMTPDEAYSYAKEAGPLTRDAVRLTRNQAAGHPEWTSEDIQERLNSNVQAARKIAKLRMLGKLQ